MVLPVLFGLATAATGAMSAIGNYQQGQAQTSATNRARLQAWQDDAAYKRWKFIRDQGAFNVAKADYDATLLESERALGKTLTGIQKQAAERYGAAAFASQARTAKGITKRGQLAASGLPKGASTDRLMAIQGYGEEGMDKAMYDDYLLRARFSDIDKFSRFQDQANSFRRAAYNRLPMAPTMAPLASRPVMQSGPSALSLIGGLGSAALGGITAGMSMASMMPKGGGGGGASDILVNENNLAVMD
jgi:hypothetical protein